MSPRRRLIIAAAIAAALTIAALAARHAVTNLLRSLP